MQNEIETKRLVLRWFREDDVHALYLLGSIPEIIRYAQSKPLASLEEARALLHAAPFHDYATHGYGRFACVWKASIDFARSSVGLSRLIALVHPDNTAAARVVTKLGFAVEKQVRYSGLHDVDVNLYARSL